MRRWTKEQLIGFSVKNLAELERVVFLGVVNMVELKVEKFASSAMPLYVFGGRRFHINSPALHNVRSVTKGIPVQLHLPIETKTDIASEIGLNAGILEHHDILLERFRTLEEIFVSFGIGSVLTMHPPLIASKGKAILEESEALANARLFFNRLDELRIQWSHQTLIGIENQSDVKRAGGNLGYLPAHFKAMLRDTRTIGLTVDTGHRRLTKAFTVREFLAVGMEIVNFHFHGNAGEFNPENWDDDQHLLPAEDNVKGYKNYLRYFRRHRTPIVLEISHLERYTDAELSEFVRKLKKELQ